MTTPDTNADPTTPQSFDKPLPRPAGKGPGVVAIAWPTGRRILPYTLDEIAAGVDVYTRAMKRDAAQARKDGHDAH